MRKFALIAAGATLAFGAAAPAAVAGPEKFTFTVTTSSAKGGTKAKPQAQRLRTKFLLEGPAPTRETQYGTTVSTIFFDKRFKFNFARFTVTCDARTVLDVPDRCPTGSKVGSGTGKATIYPLPNDPSPLTLTAFQGPNRKLFIRVFTDEPTEVKGIIVGTISRATGKYGYKLRAVIPGEREAAQGYGNLRNPTGDIIPTLSEFILTTGATFRGRRYIESTGCTSGGWNFRADLQFTDGTKASDTARAACRR